MTFAVDPVEGYDVPQKWLDAAAEIGKSASYISKRVKGKKIYLLFGDEETWKHFNEIMKPKVGGNNEKE